MVVVSMASAFESSGNILSINLSGPERRKWLCLISVLGFFGTISAIGYYVFPLMSTGCDCPLDRFVTQNGECVCRDTAMCLWECPVSLEQRTNFSFPTCYDNLKEISCESL